MLFNATVIPESTFYLGYENLEPVKTTNGSVSWWLMLSAFSFTTSYIYAYVRYSVYMSYKGFYAHSAMVYKYNKGWLT